MAHWLDEHKPKQLKVLVSPTVRTRQTAAAFSEDFEIVSSLGPDGGVADILAAAEIRQVVDYLRRWLQG